MSRRTRSEVSNAKNEKKKCREQFKEKLSDRKKHIWLKESTDYDIRFCFQNSKVRISKQSKTTYAMWCDKNNIQWCDKEIPKEWMVKNDRVRKK